MILLFMSVVRPYKVLVLSYTIRCQQITNYVRFQFIHLENILYKYKNCNLTRVDWHWIIQFMYICCQPG